MTKRDKILVVSQDNEWIRKLVPKLEKLFEVIVATPDIGFATFRKEEPLPDIVLVAGCDDVTVSTPEVKAWKNLKSVVGDHTVLMRCGNQYDDGNDFIEIPFLAGHLAGKVEALRQLRVSIQRR